MPGLYDWYGNPEMLSGGGMDGNSRQGNMGRPQPMMDSQPAFNSMDMQDTPNLANIRPQLPGVQQGPEMEKAVQERAQGLTQRMQQLGDMQQGMQPGGGGQMMQWPSPQRMPQPNQNPYAARQSLPGMDQSNQGMGQSNLGDPRLGDPRSNQNLMAFFRQFMQGRGNMLPNSNM